MPTSICQLCALHNIFNAFWRKIHFFIGGTNNGNYNEAIAEAPLDVSVVQK